MEIILVLDSDQDTVNESGHYSVDSSDVPISADGDVNSLDINNFPTTRQAATEQNLKRWKLNYHEAAIYLQVLILKNHCLVIPAKYFHNHLINF